MLCFILGSNAVWAQEVTRKHVVESLDNFYSLSLKYDISIEDLKLANPGITSPRPGDILIIPQKYGKTEELHPENCVKLRKYRPEIFHVALMIPLYLEQVADTTWRDNLNLSKINEIAPFKFIQFYQGFMVAVDSLKKEGLNVEICVYDIDHLTSKALNVISKPELKKMDIIFGPFFKSSFSIVAEFARDNKIPIINPLSARNDILLDNPYVFKLLPSVESQPALIAELVSKDFRNHNIILYVANKFQNSELIEQYKQAIEQTDMTGKLKVAVVDYSVDSTKGFRNHASLSRPNLVIIYAENEVLPAAFLSKLSAMKNEYRISVIGLPDWEKFTNIESGYLIALNTHVFMSSFIDSQSEEIKGFTKTYRERYFDEPLNYAYSGFDAGFFFMGTLLNYGKKFEGCVNESGIHLIQNQYHFKRNGDDGYDNINWNVLQYYDYSLIKKSF